MADAAGTNYWNTTWKNLPPFERYQGPVYEYHSVLAKFLTQAHGREAIEVGCVPGNCLIYLAKQFGYRVSGVDYSDQLSYTRENLRSNGICDAELFQCDLFHFHPPKQYDLVFSYGFVEHFDDHEQVIRRHEELTAPGGMVVIIVPNLTHLHRVLCGRFAPQILAVHRFPLMHAEILRRGLEGAGLEVLHCKYNKTFRPTYPLPPALDFCSRALQKSLRLLRLDNIGNRFGSPYLISVARKPKTKLGHG
jgi:cyclopropane fatty-acyl-phospholipid synthase-like methyltransferase